MQQNMKKTERIIRNMRYSVKKNHFSYINSDSVLKSLVIRAIWLAVMGVMTS